MTFIRITPNSTDETLCFEVKSSSRNITHEVYFDIDNGWYCSCEQYQFRKKPCRHMKQVQQYYKKFYEIMNSNFIFKGK